MAFLDAASGIQLPGMDQPVTGIKTPGLYPGMPGAPGAPPQAPPMDPAKQALAWIMALAKGGDKAPAAPATVGPNSNPPPIPQVPPLPRTPTTFPVPQEGKTFNFQGPGAMPPAPQHDLSEVPKMAIPGGVDYSAVRKWMDQAAPKQPDPSDLNSANLSAVLGGLSQGATTVSPSQPGSLAATLAAMGAGGMKGLHETQEQALQRDERYQEAQRQYAQTRATQEMTMAAQQHAAKIEDAKVNFENAKLYYQAHHENDMLRYEQQLKERGEAMPHVQSDNNGLHATTYDPKTGNFQLQTMPKSVMERAEQTAAMIKATTGSDPASNAAFMRMMQETEPNPVLRRAAFEEKIVKDLVSNQQAGVIFAKYPEIVQQAKKNLQQRGAEPMAMTKPVEYQQLMDKEITSLLFNHIRQQRDDRWIARAADNGHFIAGVIMKGE